MPDPDAPSPSRRTPWRARADGPLSAGSQPTSPGWSRGRDRVVAVGGPGAPVCGRATFAPGPTVPCSRGRRGRLGRIASLHPIEPAGLVVDGERGGAFGACRVSRRPAPGRVPRRGVRRSRHGSWTRGRSRGVGDDETLLARERGRDLPGDRPRRSAQRYYAWRAADIEAIARDARPNAAGLPRTPSAAWSPVRPCRVAPSSAPSSRWRTDRSVLVSSRPPSIRPPRGGAICSCATPRARDAARARRASGASRSSSGSRVSSRRYVSTASAPMAAHRRRTEPEAELDAFALHRRHRRDATPGWVPSTECFRWAPRSAATFRRVRAAPPGLAARSSGGPPAAGASTSGSASWSTTHLRAFRTVARSNTLAIARTLAHFLTTRRAKDSCGARGAGPSCAASDGGNRSSDGCHGTPSMSAKAHASRAPSP